jgi:hypothetical protein|nr:MAG TPA: hypothetical protein [Caudoviricetes sp.]
MNTQNFKYIEGVCENSDVLAQIDAYLKENAAAIREDILHAVTIKVDGKNAIAEINGGIYAHENYFAIKVIQNEEEIGYCEINHEFYIETLYFD